MYFMLAENENSQNTRTFKLFSFNALKLVRQTPAKHYFCCKNWSTSGYLNR